MMDLDDDMNDDKNGGKKYCVLAVDDEPHNIRILYDILSPLYTVKTAKNGQAAINVAEKFIPDLILLDILMPDMSGFDVIRQLRESDLTRGIPVIFITGLDSRQNEETGLILGAVDYITKPFNTSIVKLRVGTHLKIVEQMRTIERFGMIDALTDIPNRRCFDHQSSIEWGRAIRERLYIGVLMIDIDNFKDFNDIYGHAHGDKVLKGVADVITDSIMRSTDLAARWGGEEFAVLLSNTDPTGTLDVAERIRAGVESLTIPCNGRETSKITVSIGANIEMPAADRAFSDFLALADKALYHAKFSGRNAVSTSADVLDSKL